jgi:hypothetical protein
MTSGRTINDVVGGFDFHQPVYEQTLSRGDRVYQFTRRASFGEPMPRIGNWFCLAGATTADLAIIHGGSGRLLQHFSVEEDIQVLEGIASKQRINWDWSGGGRGGGTQIFVPTRSVSMLRCLGADV